jgi:hypothetical protein
MPQSWYADHCRFLEVNKPEEAVSTAQKAEITFFLKNGVACSGIEMV